MKKVNTLITNGIETRFLLNHKLRNKTSAF